MRRSLFCLIFRRFLLCRFFMMSKQPFDLSYLKTHSTTRLSCCQCLIGNGFVSQWKREVKRESLFFDFGVDDRTCSEQSERNRETGEFIRYSEALAAQGQVANKVCRQCNLHCRKSVTAV